MSAIPYSHWPKIDKYLLKKLWAEGVTIAEIMATLNRSYAGVKSMRIKLGLPRRLSPGNPTSARVLTPDEEKQLKEAFNAMLPLADIGNALHLTPARVSAAAVSLGLTRVMSRGGLGGGTGRAAVIPRAEEDRIDKDLNPLCVEILTAKKTAQKKGLRVKDGQIVEAGMGLIREDAKRGRG